MKKVIVSAWSTSHGKPDNSASTQSKPKAPSIERLSIKQVLPWKIQQLRQELRGKPQLLRTNTEASAGILKRQARASKSHWRQLALEQYEEVFSAEANTASYAHWIEQVEKPRWQNVSIQQRLLNLTDGPLFSVILPVYRTPLHHLRACIDSVLKQSYTNWELCIADDASNQRDLIEMLKSYAAQHPQIRLVLRPQNGHISAASNSALELASGDFVALLDHDDLLAPHALLAVAERIAEDPNLMLIYSDEDKVDAHGERHAPYFKPDWNPELLRGQNYLCHLCVYQRALLNQLGGFLDRSRGSTGLGSGAARHGAAGPRSDRTHRRGPLPLESNPAPRHSQPRRKIIS